MAHDEPPVGDRCVRWLRWRLQQTGVAGDRASGGTEFADRGATEIANYETVARG